MLNGILLAGCAADLQRRIDGRPQTVGEAWAIERPLLVVLPAEPFDACEAAAPRVDQKSLVTIRQNRYSVPVALAGFGLPPLWWTPDGWAIWPGVEDVRRCP